MKIGITSAAAAGTIALSLLLAACSSGEGGAESTGAGEETSSEAGGGSEETVTVTVGTLRGQPHFYQPFLYNDYAVDGLEFEVVTLDTTPALSDALISGQIDFAITGVTPTISSIASGRDLKIVAAAADGGSGFIGGEGVDSIEDLVGLDVGYIQGSAQEVVLRLLLAEAGVDAADLNLQTIPVTEMASAFTTGSIDAFMGVEIGVSIAKGAGGHEIADPYSTEVGMVNIGFVTTGDLIASDPELVQKVVDTHVATTAYMADNVTEWLPVMVAEFGGDEAVFTSAMENFWLRADLSDEYASQLEALAAGMLDVEFIDAVPDITDIVDQSFAPAS